MKAYTTVGGTPHLDGAYTVFGEVLEGIDIVDKYRRSRLTVTTVPKRMWLLKSDSDRLMIDSVIPFMKINKRYLTTVCGWCTMRTPARRWLP